MQASFLFRCVSQPNIKSRHMWKQLAYIQSSYLLLFFSDTQCFIENILLTAKKASYLITWAQSLSAWRSHRVCVGFAWSLLQTWSYLLPHRIKVNIKRFKWLKTDQIRVKWYKIVSYGRILKDRNRHTSMRQNSAHKKRTVKERYS